MVLFELMSIFHTCIAKYLRYFWNHYSYSFYLEFTQNWKKLSHRKLWGPDKCRTLMYIDVTIGGKISTTSHMYQVTHYLVPTQLSSPLASSGGRRCYHSFLFDFTSSFILIDKRSPSSTFLIITKQANQNLLISVT